MAVERLDHQTHILAYNPYNPDNRKEPKQNPGN